LILWSGWLLIEWGRDATPRLGWNSAIDTTLMLLLTILLCYAWRSSRKPWMMAVLIFALGVEFKAFGTGKRFNATKQSNAHEFSRRPFPNLDPDAYREMLANRQFRVASDRIAPYPTELRHVGLASPQGSDPLLSAAYSNFADSHGLQREDRIIHIPPADERQLKQLGVRYYITTEGMPDHLRYLSRHPRFRHVGKPEGWNRVFEYLDAQPPYRFAAGETELLNWEPRHRRFRVRSPNGGDFVLVEQMFPGWSARVDGQLVQIDRAEGVFQSIRIAPGEHEVRFDYHSSSLRTGAWISAAALVAGILIVRLL
jgi:hypothetical protein